MRVLGMKLAIKEAEIMKRKRYSVAQNMAAVKQHEAGATVAEICRKLGIAEGTFYRWKKDNGGLEEVYDDAVRCPLSILRADRSDMPVFAAEAA
jgi:putative transposase